MPRSEAAHRSPALEVRDRALFKATPHAASAPDDRLGVVWDHAVETQRCQRRSRSSSASSALAKAARSAGRTSNRLRSTYTDDPGGSPAVPRAIVGGRVGGRGDRRSGRCRGHRARPRRRRTGVRRRRRMLEPSPGPLPRAHDAGGLDLLLQRRPHLLCGRAFCGGQEHASSSSPQAPRGVVDWHSRPPIPQSLPEPRAECRRRGTGPSATDRRVARPTR